MAKEQETQSAKTTLTVSRSFANIMVALARDAGLTVLEYCDRKVAPQYRERAKAAVKRRLESIDLGGEG